MLQTSAAIENQIIPVANDFLGRPVRDLTFVAFDTETTGRHPIVSRVLEISAIKFKGTGEVLETRTQLINPEQSIPADVIAIHGITQSMVAQSPNYREVIPAFVNWMSSLQGGICDPNNMPVLVAHNALFDVGFLQVALSRMGLAMPQNAVLDTLHLSRKLIRDSQNHKLKTLVEHLGFESDTYHRAEADSLHVMRLFLHMIRQLGNKCTLRDLIDESGAIFFQDPITVIHDHASARDPRVRTIGDAISSGSDMQIHYRGFGIKDRRITPLSVMLSGRKYYLSAYCHAVNSERTFRVDRIGNIELLEQAGKGN